MLLQRRILYLIVGRITGRQHSYFVKSFRNKFTKTYKSDMDAVAQSTNVRMATPMSRLIAVGQMCSTNDKKANLDKVSEMVSKAKAASASMLFLPECCDFIGQDRKETLSLAEPLTGPTMEKYKRLARQSRLWLSLGGLHELDCSEDDDGDGDGGKKSQKIYNSHVIINDCGEIVSVYRKLHLFDVDTPSYRFRESDVVLPGGELVAPVETPIGKMGLLICYDMRFAEVGGLLRKMGAGVLTYPSAFTYATGQAHWEILLRARAIENQCFVIAAAQVGKHNAKRQSWGHASIIDPWGRVLADCGGMEQTVSIAEIDLAITDSIRRSMPCFNHRRDDVYALSSIDGGCWNPSEDRCFADNVINRETIFYESEYCYAFTNLCCVVKGHILVSTKRIAKRLKDLKCAEISDLFVTVCKIQRMLEDIYQTSSATVTVQDGPLAGQTVPHVHFHVMPRRRGDFGHNDQVYSKLEDNDESKQKRTMEQRACEAEIYREYFQAREENKRKAFESKDECPPGTAGDT